MHQPFRILHLEDEPDYSAFVRALLLQESIAAKVQLVTNRADFEDAVRQNEYDVILADYSLPDYSGLQALAFAREHAVQTPFLLISGNIGEQAAIESLKTGATDYVLKQCPERLVPAICRAVREGQQKAEARRVSEELARREHYFRTLTENSLDLLTILTLEGQLLYISPSIRRVLGYEPEQLNGACVFDFIHPADRELALAAFREAIAHPEKALTLSFRALHVDGVWRHLEAVGQNKLDDPYIRAVVVTSRDITDRKLVEQGLRESESCYRAIFDNNPMPMWIFDHETLAFLEVNAAAVQVYGYSREEFLNMRLQDIRVAEESPALLEYLHKLIGTENPGATGFSGAWQHRLKGGGIIEVELKWSTITFRGRRASLTMVNDITQRKRIERRNAVISKLTQNLSSATSPKAAAAIIRGIADDLFQWDGLTVELYSSATDSVHPLLKVDTDESGNRFELPLAESDESPSDLARQVIEQGAQLICMEPEIGEEQPTDLTETGRTPVSILTAPIRNGSAVIGILAIRSHQGGTYRHEDLSVLQTVGDCCGGALERIRTEQALRGSETLFHSAWENSGDGMRLTDADGIIVAVNQAFCGMIGLPREELEGKPFTVMFAESERPEVLLEQYRQRFRERVAETQMERRIVLRSGKAADFEHISSYVELGPQCSLLFALFRDVTAQRHLEDQLRQAQKMEAIGQLAGGVAHDFNNILTVIHGHSSLLMATASLTTSGMRSAQEINRAAERAAALTRQLLAFGRRQLMQPRLLDMNEVVTNMARMLGRILGEDIALQVKYHLEPAMVLADACMMEQVLMNLAVNARDAMPGGGVLTVKILVKELNRHQLPQDSEFDPGKFVCLMVADTGCGIPPENLRRIFEPFFTTKEVGKGTGLGLATVYGIVRQHRGWVEVESEPGRGAVFLVHLPYSAPQGVSKVEASPAKVVRGGSETILVVEDEAPVRELVCHFLKDHGYQVLEAESGLKAIEVWAKNRSRIDLLLTDLVMPDRVNGRELAKRLKSDRPDLKVIFTSGYSADVVGKDFILKSGLNYLQKPYQPNALAEAVRDCLDCN